MSQTVAGLIDLGNGQGVTTHYAFSYDTSFLVSPNTNQPVADLMASAEQDFDLMQSWFEGVNFPFNGSQVPVQIVPQTSSAGGASWQSGDSPPTVTIIPAGFYTAQTLRYLLVSEVTEMFMMGQNLGWIVPGSDEGSMGEGLSRFLGEQFLHANGFGDVAIGPEVITPRWLNGARANYIDRDPDDNLPDQVTGCTLLFLWYLHSQLNHHIQNIVKAASFNNLADVYRNLGAPGGSGAAWNNFSSLIEKHYPAASPSGHPYTYHPAGDNLFPVSNLHSLKFPSAIVRGHSKSATIHLDHPAMAEVRVFLASSDSNCISVPGHVTFQPGDIAFHLTLAAAKQTLPFHAKDVTIKASYAGVTKTATIKVGPPRILHFTCNAKQMFCSQSAVATLTLDVASTDGPTPITLTSDHPEFITFDTPPLTIPQGLTQAPFGCSSQNVPFPFSPIEVKITAALPDSNSKSFKLRIVPPTLFQVSVQPNPAECGSSPTVWVTLNSPSQLGDVPVDLSWSPNFVGSPFHITIPAGAIAQDQTVNIPYPLAPFAPTGGVLSATCQGVTVTAGVNLTPSPYNAVIESLSLPVSVQAGQLVTATINLQQSYNFQVPVGLQASTFIAIFPGKPPLPGPAPEVPAQVLIPPNTQSYPFTFPTNAVPNGETYTLSIVASAFGTFANDMKVIGS